MQEAFQIVHAEMAHRAGYSGMGVGVAVLDTGIFPHADLRERLVAFEDMLSLHGRPYDDCGHGTHVAGIIGGDGRFSRGRYLGIAPRCLLAGIKVLDHRGDGNISHLLMGLQWVLEHHEEYRIRIVNISVGTKLRRGMGEDSVLVRKVDELWDAGLVVVVAAGNDGPEAGTVTTPGNSRKVITVGCSDDDKLAMVHGRRRRYFSGRGPTEACVVKPEVVAPGASIISCNVFNRRGAMPYTLKSGTSMATPIVSGAIALLLEKEPRLTNAEVKLRLWESCDRKKAAQGFGLLHIGRLLELC